MWEVLMSTTVGVREFRKELAGYIEGDEPVTVTRHGRRVGVFIPTKGDRDEAIAAYRSATDKLQALLAEHGIDEDEVVAEFQRVRRPGHGGPAATSSTS
jgi:prevent-host-death family protein